MHKVSVIYSAIAVCLLLIILLLMKSSDTSYNNVIQHGAKNVNQNDVNIKINDKDNGNMVDEKMIFHEQVKRAGWIYQNDTYRPPNAVEESDRRNKTYKRPPFPYESNREKLNYLLFKKPKGSNYTEEEMDLLFDAAERGTGYDPYDDDNIQSPHGSHNPTRIWNVVLWGRWRGIIEMSGCPEKPNLGSCPYHPNCAIFTSNKLVALKQRADVVIIPIYSVNIHPQEWIFPEKEREKPYRIGYQREPFWWVSRYDQPKYDMQMSMRINTGILNPIFFHEPSYLFEHGKDNFKPFKERHFFALSIISDCAAESLRHDYIKKLTAYLGKRRIHQYGKCGDGHFLPYSQEKVLAKVSKYKFYFAFENTIEPGYVSEKLGRTLSYGPIPVYYGAPDVPKITRTPSFINVLNFKSPGELAKYLLFLSENEEEYNKYHQWRHQKNPFDPEYLKLLAIQKPGPVETHAHAKVLGTRIRANRRAACCRLCNEAWIKKMLETHRHEVFDPPMHHNWINKVIFNGTLNQPIHANMLLKDDSLENDGHDEFSNITKVEIVSNESDDNEEEGYGPKDINEGEEDGNENNNDDGER